MNGNSIRRTVLCHLFYAYLKCLEKTVKIGLKKPEEFRELNVIGFWHEDSFAMNLVLKQLTERNARVKVLVTGDERGEYIQYMLEKCGGEAVRIEYGPESTKALVGLLKDLKKKESNVAVALDGPLGPRHIPKKLPFLLSEKSRTELVGVTVAYSRRISLKKRWDHYKIPLPFSTITVQFDNYGIADSKSNIALRVCQKDEECSIISTEAISRA